MFEGVQLVIPVLSFQCMKSPGGNFPVHVKIWDHPLNVSHHAFLVGQNGATDFAGMVTPHC